MFDWFFKPSCPLDAQAKAWLEYRLNWLADEFGADTFLARAVVTPSDEFFPDHYTGSDACIERLFLRTCKYMDVQPNKIDLELFTDHQSVEFVNDSGQALGGAAGTFEHGDWGRRLIRIERSQGHDPMTLVGTIAHELAHERLLGENRVDREIFDNELLTDLTVVFHGLGIFLANVPRTWDSDYSKWPGTTINKPEYMTQPMFGYAMAHAAWCRDDSKPAWAKHLNYHARVTFKQSLRFLDATAGTTFDRKIPLAGRAPKIIKFPRND